MEILKNETKYDFTSYRKQTLNRRIDKRKSINKLNSLSYHNAFLQKSEEEHDILVSEFLIGVTRFFRDDQHFKTLEEIVIPKIIESKAKGETNKLWVIGCGTGEEAYTLVILLKEALRINKSNLDFKIFATDINVKAIEKGSKGTLKKYYP